MTSMRDLIHGTATHDIAELSLKIEQEQRKHLFIERVTLGGSMVFIVLIMLAAWLTDGAIFQGAIEALQTLEPQSRPERNAVLNCRKPENMNTPYCQDRIAETSRDWRMISRQWGSKQAFNLTDK